MRLSYIAFFRQLWSYLCTLYLSLRLILRLTKFFRGGCRGETFLRLHFLLILGVAEGSPWRGNPRSGAPPPSKSKIFYDLTVYSLPMYSLPNVWVMVATPNW